MISWLLQPNCYGCQAGCYSQTAVAVTAKVCEFRVRGFGLAGKMMMVAVVGFGQG